MRNCSVNTLFSCVVGLGDSLSAAQWRLCLSQTLFGVLEEISARGSQHEVEKDTLNASNSTEKKSNRYKVTVHHSRDSSTKQWGTTQVLALRGLERVLRQFFPKLLLAATCTSNHDSAEIDDIDAGGFDSGSDWFKTTWARILDFAYNCATLTGGRDTLDLRVVGADLMVLCAQLSSKAGVGAASTPARVGTNMQVINGALRSVKPSRTDQTSAGKEQGPMIDNDTVEYRRHLFLMAFKRLEELCVNLEHQSIHYDGDGSTVYVESALLQLLTKLSGGLSKLYECCKENEVAPPRLVSQKEGRSTSLESRMVHTVALVMKSSFGDPKSKYLTQAQRACLDLLKGMSLDGSVSAFDELASFSGNAYYLYKSGYAGENNADDSAANDIDIASRSLEFECANVVAELFMNESVDSLAKLHVFESILASFIKMRTSEKVTRMDEGALRYDLFLPIFCKGLEVVSSHDGIPQGDGDENDGIWVRVIAVLSYILMPYNDDSNWRTSSYATNPQEVEAVVSLCVKKLPTKFNDDVGSVLRKGAENSAKFSRECRANDTDDSHITMNDEDISTLRRNCLRIFQACFGGLCNSQPTSQMLISLSETLLKGAVDGAAQTASMKENNKDDFDARIRTDIDVEVALFVCESLRKLPNLEEVAISLFPWLCKLTRSDSAALRTEAGVVLSSVDLVGVIERAQQAEARAAIAEKRYEKLLAEANAIKEENEELKRQAMLGI